MTRVYSVMIALALSCGIALYGQSQKPEPAREKPNAVQRDDNGRQHNGQQPKSDNTKTNKLDRENGGLTAGQQKMNAHDREITQKIRKTIVNDKTLSIYAHNIKIITRDGVVTLKGPVRSEQERFRITALSEQVAGAANVRNELTVASKDSEK